MTSRTATLRLQLIDAVSGPSKNAAGSLGSIDNALSRLGRRGSPEIRRLAKQLEYLQKKSGSIEDFTANRRGFKDLAEQMKAARTNIARLTQDLKSAARPTEKMRADLKSAKNALKATTQAFREQGAAVRQSERALSAFGIAGRRGISSSQQAIRNEIAKTIREMRRLDQEGRKPARPTPTSRRDRIANSISGGGSPVLDAAMAAGGVRMTAGARDIVVGAAQAEGQRVRILNTSGGDRREVAAAGVIAADVSRKFPLVSQAEALGFYSETRSQGAGHGGKVDLDRMRRNVESLAVAKTALEASNADFTPEDAKALSQALEGSGRATDPKGLSNLLDAYVKAKQTWGNAISAQGIRDFVQNAKAANFSMSDSGFFEKGFARLAQGNASRLGNEFSQTMNTLVGGHMTKQGANWLVKQGMIEPGQIVNGGGGKFSIDGDIKGSDLLSADPTEWANEILLPGLLKSGAVSDDRLKVRMETLRKADPNTDEETLRERAQHGLLSDEIQKSGFRSTVTDQLAHAIANYALTTRDVAQMRQASGLGAANNVGQNPTAAFDELTTSLSNFGSVLGGPIMRDAAGVMHSFAGGISEVTGALDRWQKSHPAAAKIAGGAAPVALAAVGASATVEGGLSLFGKLTGKAMPKGPLTRMLGWGRGLLGGEGLAGASGLLGSAAIPALAAATLGRGSLVNDPTMLAYVRKRLEEQRRQATGKAATDGQAKPIREELGGIIQDWPLQASAAMSRYVAALTSGGQDAEAEAQRMGEAIKQALAITARPDVDTGQLERALTLARQLAAVLRGEASGGGASSSAPASGAVGGARAGGGSVQAGKTYAVGGNGIELFTPSSNGHITPNHQLGGVVVKIVNNVHLHGSGGKADAEELTRTLDRQIRRSAETAFTSVRYGDD